MAGEIFAGLVQGLVAAKQTKMGLEDKMRQIQYIDEQRRLAEQERQRRMALDNLDVYSKQISDLNWNLNASDAERQFTLDDINKNRQLAGLQPISNLPDVVGNYFQQDLSNSRIRVSKGEPVEAVIADLKYKYGANDWLLKSIKTLTGMNRLMYQTNEAEINVVPGQRNPQMAKPQTGQEGFVKPDSGSPTDKNIANQQNAELTAQAQSDYANANPEQAQTYTNKPFTFMPTVDEYLYDTLKDYSHIETTQQLEERKVKLYKDITDIRMDSGDSTSTLGLEKELFDIEKKQGYRDGEFNRSYYSGLGVNSPNQLAKQREDARKKVFDMQSGKYNKETWDAIKGDNPLTENVPYSRPSAWGEANIIDKTSRADWTKTRTNYIKKEYDLKVKKAENEFKLSSDKLKLLKWYQTERLKIANAGLSIADRNAKVRELNGMAFRKKTDWVMNKVNGLTPKQKADLALQYGTYLQNSEMFDSTPNPDITDILEGTLGIGEEQPATTAAPAPAQPQPKPVSKPAEGSSGTVTIDMVYDYAYKNATPELRAKMDKHTKTYGKESTLTVKPVYDIYSKRYKLGN